MRLAVVLLVLRARLTTGVITVAAGTLGRLTNLGSCTDVSDRVATVRTPCATTTQLSRLLTGATTGGGTLERRLGQRAGHATHRTTGAVWHTTLQLVELTAEIGDRRVRTVLDPGAEQGWDQHSCPSSCYDQQDEFAHVEDPSFGG